MQDARLSIEAAFFTYLATRTFKYWERNWIVFKLFSTWRFCERRQLRNSLMFGLVIFFLQNCNVLYMFNAQLKTSLEILTAWNALKDRRKALSIIFIEYKDLTFATSTVRNIQNLDNTWLSKYLTPCKINDEIFEVM